MAEVGHLSGRQPCEVATWAELRTEGCGEKTWKHREHSQEHVECPEWCKALRNNFSKDLQGK